MGEIKLFLPVPEVDGNGHQGISVQIVPPTVNERGVYEGGKFLLFANDHVRQRVDVCAWHFQNGGFHFDRKVKEIKDEVFAPEECLKWAKDNMKSR